MMPRNCNFCGLCCTLAVKVTEHEIKKIESLGHKNFTETDGSTTILKRPGGWCTFFERKNNIGYCKIYESRPAPCKDFPGKMCELRDNVLFKNTENMSQNVKLLWEKAPKKSDPLPQELPKFPD